MMGRGWPPEIHVKCMRQESCLLTQVRKSYSEVSEGQSWLPQARSGVEREQCEVCDCLNDECGVCYASGPFLGVEERFKEIKNF
jgi:hypothetical protein